MSQSVVRKIENTSLTLSNIIIALAVMSFALSHNLSADHNNRFIFSAVVLAIISLILRFTFSDIRLLHRSMYRLATVMSFWALGLYFFAAPQFILYIIILPAVYYLFRLETKSQIMAEDKIAAGFLFGLGAFLYIQQQPLQVLLFTDVNFHWRSYLSQSPILIICGAGLMRLHKYANWSGLALLGTFLLITGLTLLLSGSLPPQLKVNPIIVSIITVSYITLALLFIDNPIIKLITKLCELKESEQRPYQLILFTVLNIILQLTLFYLILDTRVNPVYLALLILCILGPLFGYQRYTVAFVLLELAIFCFPLLQSLLPEFSQYYRLPLASTIITAVLLRRYKGEALFLPNVLFLLLFVIYFWAIFQYPLLTPLGLGQFAFIFICWMLLPQRPLNINPVMHGYLLPFITALIIVCLRGGIHTQLLPIWSLSNLVILLLLWSLIANKQFMRFAIAKKWYAVKSWHRNIHRLSLVLVALATASAIASLVLNSGWYAGFWEPVVLQMLVLSICSGIMLYLTLSAQSTRYALLCEAYVWSVLALMRWKLEIMEIMRLGSPIDGYVLVGVACVFAGIKEIIKKHAQNFNGYFQRATIMYAVLGWGYFLWSYSVDQAHYHNELSALILSALFYWLSRSNKKLNLMLSFIFGNAAIIVFFVRQDVANLMFYAIPVLVSVLMLAHQFRDELDDRQQRLIRLYCSLIILGISAFYNAVDFNDSVWYPIVAALVAAAGVVVGISLRVRIYLYLGTLFFFGNITTAVIHVIVNQPPENTKLIIGVVFLLTGLLFTASFILFQMKRQQILAYYNNLVGELESWEK